MGSEPYRRQKETKDRNRHIILAQLERGPKRFVDLRTSTHLSDTGLSEILKEMTKLSLIEKKIFQGHEAYSITQNGIERFGESWYLLFEIFEMKEQGATYNQNGDITGWGIKTDLIKKITWDDGIVPPPVPFSHSLEKAVFREIKKKIAKYKIKNVSGKVILSFEIDYDKLMPFLRMGKSAQRRKLQSVEQSFAEAQRVVES